MTTSQLQVPDCREDARAAAVYLMDSVMQKRPRGAPELGGVIE